MLLGIFRWLKYVVTLLCLKLRFIPKWSSGEAPFLAQASATRATSSASRRCSWRVYHNSMGWPRSVISHKRLYSVARLGQVPTRTSLRILFSLRFSAFRCVLHGSGSSLRNSSQFSLLCSSSRCKRRVNSSVCARASPAHVGNMGHVEVYVLYHYVPVHQKKVPLESKSMKPIKVSIVLKIRGLSCSFKYSNTEKKNMADPGVCPRTLKRSHPVASSNGSPFSYDRTHHLVTLAAPTRAVKRTGG